MASCTLVTGASSGIGRAAAIRLSARRPLILHGRDTGRLEDTRRLCANPDLHVIWTHDLRDTDTIAASLGALLIPAGRTVDAFVHSAGMVTPLPVRDTSARTVLDTMAVNCLAAVEIAHCLVRRKTNAAALANIVLVSSIWSRYGARAHSAYCASKAALDGWMRAAAVELAPAVRVNSILPGAIESPMSKEVFDEPEIAARMKRDYPLGTGYPEDVAAVIDFLLSPEARWITGQQFLVDGGRTANLSH